MQPPDQQEPALDPTHLGSGPEQPSAPAPTLPAGEVLGSYEIQGLIGRGGMGEVYLARHARLGRQVALKVLRQHHADNSEIVQRFFQEARSVNEINHEHIVEIHDFVEDRSVEGRPRVYLVMELLTGRSLAEVMAAGPVRLRRAVKLLRQVCEALGAAHQVGVVHRDVKPDNIFITERAGQRDFVKVLDFGVAKLEPKVRKTTPETVEGVVMGTPAYMAPEQASALGSDARSDIYAVGTLLFELVAGRLPFDGQHFLQLAMQVVSQPAPPLPSQSRSGEEVPPRLRELVAKTLEKDRARRPQTLREVADELEACLAELGPDPGALPTPAPGEVPPVLAAPPRSARPFLVAGAILALCAAAAVVLGVGGEAPAESPAVEEVAGPAPAPALSKEAAPPPEPAPEQAPPAVEPAPDPAPVKKLNRDSVLDPYAP